MVSIPEHLAEEHAKQMEEIQCAQIKDKNTPSREILDLLDEVKERFHSKPKSTDMKILAAIAKAEEGDFDYYKLDDALQMINVRFNISEEETNDELDFVAQAFGDRLVVENMAQLVSKYNSVMDNVRHYFPDFEFTQPSNNYVYGKNINVSCLLRWCSDKDIVQEYRNNIISKEFDDLYSPNNMEKIMADMKLYYSEKYKGDMKQLADLHKGSAYSLIPPELKNLLGYAVYQGDGFEQIQDFMRSDKLLSKPADTVRVLQSFFSSAVLPFYSPTDVTIYRGDRLMHSSQQVNMKGFLSGTLHISKLENFLKKSGRIIQINIPAGTPIIPIFLESDQELEVCLLPGTKLTRNYLYDHSDQSHFAEYDVTGNPPKFTPREEATIIKFAIPGVIRVTADEKASHPIHRPKRSKVMEFVEKLPFGHYLDLGEFRLPEEQYDDDGEPFDVDLSDLDERAEFYMNLVNKYYQGEY